MSTLVRSSISFFPDLSVGLVTVLSDLIWKITVNFYAGHIMCKVVKFAQVSFITFIPTFNVLPISIPYPLQ